jgi:hypothetical protein
MSKNLVYGVLKKLLSQSNFSLSHFKCPDQLIFLIYIAIKWNLVLKILAKDTNLQEKAREADCDRKLAHT